MVEFHQRCGIFKPYSFFARGLRPVSMFSFFLAFGAMAFSVARSGLLSAISVA